MAANNKIPPTQINLSKDWLNAFNNRIDQEFATARNNWTTMHQWVISLTVGGVTAVLAFSGGTFNYPTPTGFIAVLCAVPLMIRLYVRSCLEYTLFQRWLVIRNATDAFLAASAGTKLKKEKKKALQSTISKYYFDYVSPKSFIAMVWDNLRIAFIWPFILLGGLLYLGFVYQDRTPLVDAVIWVVAVFTFLEIYWFLSYYRFTYISSKT